MPVEHKHRKLCDKLGHIFTTVKVNVAAITGSGDNFTIFADIDVVQNLKHNSTWQSMTYLALVFLVYLCVYMYCRVAGGRRRG